MFEYEYLFVEAGKLYYDYGRVIHYRNGTICLYENFT